MELEWKCERRWGNERRIVYTMYQVRGKGALEKPKSLVNTFKEAEKYINLHRKNTKKLVGWSGRGWQV